jgi:hypothetical protein
MRKGSFFVTAALLLLNLASMRAVEPAPAANNTKTWDALWRFDTHG